MKKLVRLRFLRCVMEARGWTGDHDVGVGVGGRVVEVGNDLVVGEFCGLNREAVDVLCIATATGGCSRSSLLGRNAALIHSYAVFLGQGEFTAATTLAIVLHVGRRVLLAQIDGLSELEMALDGVLDGDVVVWTHHNAFHLLFVVELFFLGLTVGGVARLRDQHGAGEAAEELLAFLGLRGTVLHRDEVGLGGGHDWRLLEWLLLHLIRPISVHLPRQNVAILMYAAHLQSLRMQRHDVWRRMRGACTATPDLWHATAHLPIV